MIRHLFRLAWHRKRSHALVLVEIVASFLVIFAVSTASLHFADNWRRPLGFDYRDVWSVRFEEPSVRMERRDGKLAPAESPETERARRILEEVRRVEGVRAAAGSHTVPYDDSTMSSTRELNSRPASYQFDEVTDGYAEALGLQVVRGRWFSGEDDGVARPPVVIDKTFAAEVFGSEDPVGRLLPLGEEGEPESRVVGVVREFRKQGELAVREPYLFSRLELTGGSDSRPMRNLVLRTDPGLDVAWEQALAARIRELAPGWPFEIRRMDDMRTTKLRYGLAPLAAGGIVAASLVVMVALGLLGVLWQNVTRRVGEIGLRRAAGASRADIATQFLLEVTVTTTLGIAMGALLASQIPLLGLLGFVRGAVFAASLTASAAVLYAVTLACGVYPALLAARVSPAEALRQE